MSAERASAYVEAGADMISRRLESLGISAVHGRRARAVLANITEFARRALQRAMSCTRAASGAYPFRVSARARSLEVYPRLRRRTQANVLERMQTRATYDVCAIRLRAQAHELFGKPLEKTNSQQQRSPGAEESVALSEFGGHTRSCSVAQQATI